MIIFYCGVQIDEVSGTVTLQLVMDYLWYDYRYNMDLFWEHMTFSYSGTDLTSILTNQSVVMWLPQVVFPDASDLHMQTEVWMLCCVCFTSLDTLQ